jgi:hypothetical protein
MDSNTLAWLTEDSNPAVKYRIQTELLGQSSDKAPVVKWLTDFLPGKWEDTNGLWFRYTVNAFSECGLHYSDIPMEQEKIIGFGDAFPFEHGCADYMHLRSLVKLGLGNHPLVAAIIADLSSRQLPDGGFLCLHRVDKLKYTPKSCYKANLHALMFCAESVKAGLNTPITEGLLAYFWKHNIFYRTDNPETLVLNAREGWRSIDTFHPFEVMRVGLHNIVEAFCALGYGSDRRLNEAWAILERKQTAEGKYKLDQTPTRSYLSKERVGNASKWVTFYALLAEKECENNGRRKAHK